MGSTVIDFGTGRRGHSPGASTDSNPIRGRPAGADSPSPVGPADSEAVEADSGLVYMSS